VVWEHRKSFAYLVLTLTLMTACRTDTQDLIPISKLRITFRQNVVAYLAMSFINVGALLATTLGVAPFPSAWEGARVSICALSLCALVIPLFGLFTLKNCSAGRIPDAVGVQGAWGVHAAHLNELSPDAGNAACSRGFVISWECSSVLHNTIEYALCETASAISGR